MTTPNDEIFKQVSQDTGTTAEAVVLQRTGSYVDEVESTVTKTSSLRQATSTVNPFGALRKV